MHTASTHVICVVGVQTENVCFNLSIWRLKNALVT